MKTAFIDLDRTLADFDYAIAKIAGKEDFTEEEMIKIYNENKSKSGFWLSFPVIQKNLILAQEIQKLGFRIHILTKGPKTSINAWSEKFQWVKENLTSLGSLGEDFDMSVTFDKSVFQGDILMDDYPPYFEKWMLNNSHNPMVIMPLTRHNKDYENDKILIYDNNMEEILKKAKNNFENSN
jgi:hypothetical protein